MPAKWSTVRIFISSTFRDMHAERDHLVKVVFPALRERLEPYQLHLVDIDLRWGITREQAERDQVLDVCLDSIDECRPFFLGILGERYGWVPKQLPDTNSKYGWTQEQTGKSVTELEILWGALLRPDLRENSIFLFRDPKFLAEMPSELRPNFAAEDEESAIKQEQLKQRIRSAGLPIDPQSYPCRFAGLRINWAIARQEMSSEEREAVEAVAKDGLVDPREYSQLDAAKQELVRRYGVPYLTGLEEFGRQVLETLWNAIRIQHRLEETSLTVAAEDPFAIEDANHEAFMESRLRVYVGRDHLYELITAAVFDNRRWPCVVSGRSGAGKSAALARFVRDFSREHPETFVIAHFIGASPESTNLRQLLRRVCAQLNRRFQLEEQVPSDIDELAALFRKLMARVPADDRVVIVIDALDQLDEADLARGLHWLPRELPANVSLVVSAILLTDRVHRVQAELMERDCVRISMAPLTPEERRAIVQAVPSISAKTLDAAQIDLLMANPETVNPLYLLVALEELRGFGSFEQLNGRIALFPQGEDAVTALFQQVIERLEHEFDAATVKLVLASLSASRRGLSDRELLELAEGPVVSLTESRSNLFSILRQLRSYLQRRGPLIGFFHRNLDQAVRERYFASPGAQADVHWQLADYFRSQNLFFESPEEQRKNVLALPPAPRAVNQRLIDEVPYQLLQSGETLEEDVA
ncbi:MAG: DUF4062 domain-containing protein [Planctomycetaceae bacterium]